MAAASCRSEIFCILPPYILHAIARNGSRGQRDFALRTLGADQSHRTFRIVRELTRERTAPILLSGTQERHRTIYDAGGAQDLPGMVARTEGEKATRDKATDEAYDGLGATYDFYWNIFDRNSLDDEGAPLIASVHYGKKYDNAFWDGQQMVFGDGDGELFNRFTIALDIIGHELTHAVTGDEVNLRYSGQSGALNESASDVFGSLIKQYKRKQTARKADWLIGQGLLTKKVSGVALRSMKAPGTAYDDDVLGKDPQPSHMSDYVTTAEDNGGVHINSGIPNRAFCILATALGGHAWEKAGRIWYDTLRDPKLKAASSFRTFASRTARTATVLFGGKSVERKAVIAAWAEVGIRVA